VTFVQAIKGMENFAGYLASGLIGISLGLIGGGGSIITVPVLVYLFHIEPMLATTYSLFIVGTTSLVGGMRSVFNKMVDFKSALLIAIPSTAGVYMTRHYFLPRIPDIILLANGFTLTRDVAMMLFFAGIMVIVSLRMINDGHITEQGRAIQYRYGLMVLQGVVVGIVSGVVGAGGGFLITPALVFLAGMPMKKAIGTSLIIIAINSSIGFVGDLSLVHAIDLSLLLILSLLAIGGVFVGTYLSRFIDGTKLKSGFGWFALAMAIFVIIKIVIWPLRDLNH
jgi:uncharacterized membrane protein YfcA